MNFKNDQTTFPKFSNLWMESSKNMPMNSRIHEKSAELIPRNVFAEDHKKFIEIYI